VDPRPCPGRSYQDYLPYPISRNSTTNGSDILVFAILIKAIQLAAVASIAEAAPCDRPRLQAGGRPVERGVHAPRGAVAADGAAPKSAVLLLTAVIPVLK
jgi:hypothetical protein